MHNLFHKISLFILLLAVSLCQGNLAAMQPCQSIIQKFGLECSELINPEEHIKDFEDYYFSPKAYLNICIQENETFQIFPVSKNGFFAVIVERPSLQRGLFLCNYYGRTFDDEVEDIDISSSKAFLPEEYVLRNGKIEIFYFSADRNVRIGFHKKWHLFVSYKRQGLTLSQALLLCLLDGFFKNNHKKQPKFKQFVDQSGVNPGEINLLWAHLPPRYKEEYLVKFSK